MQPTLTRRRVGLGHICPGGVVGALPLTPVFPFVVLSVSCVFRFFVGVVLLCFVFLEYLSR